MRSRNTCCCWLRANLTRKRLAEENSVRLVTIINNIHSIYSSTLQTILDKHKELFQDELGLVKEVKTKIYVDPIAQPRYYKPRPVPYALYTKVEQELERLELEHVGIIKPVQFSAPIVPIVKGDASIQICGDYKVTVNRAAKVETYPLMICWPH